MKAFSLSIAIISTLLLVALGGVAFGIYSSVISLQARSLGLDNDIAEEQNKDFRTARSQEIIDNLLLSHDKLKTHVVSQNSLVEFLGLLENTGRRIGSDVSVISVRDIKEENIIEVTLNVDGSFGAVFKTLSAFENLPVIVNPIRGGFSLVRDSDTKGESWSASAVYQVAKYSPTL